MGSFLAKTYKKHPSVSPPRRGPGQSRAGPRESGYGTLTSLIDSIFVPGVFPHLADETATTCRHLWQCSRTKSGKARSSKMPYNELLYCTSTVFVHNWIHEFMACVGLTLHAVTFESLSV